MSAPTATILFVGILIVVTRGPLLIAPARTVSAYRSMAATNLRVRILSLVVASVGALMVWSSSGANGTAATIMYAWGCLMLPAVLFLVLAPATYREVVDIFFDMGDEALRFLGALGTLIGVYMIYYALTVT